MWPLDRSADQCKGQVLNQSQGQSMVESRKEDHIILAIVENLGT